MVRVKRNAIEGIQSKLIKDTTKVGCWYCGGTSFIPSSLLDDGNDTADTNFSALSVTISGGSIQGLIGICSECGQENVIDWHIRDIATGCVGAAVTFTNLDASVADGLTGYYAIYHDAAGTDTGLYYVIASNTEAAPTVVTMTIATNDDETGYWTIQKYLPLGLTAAS